MSLNNRLKALKAKHDSLTARIQNEWCRLEPNQAFLRTLKTKRLRVKEEMASFSQSSY